MGLAKLPRCLGFLSLNYNFTLGRRSNRTTLKGLAGPGRERWETDSFWRRGVVKNPIEEGKKKGSTSQGTGVSIRFTHGKEHRTFRARRSTRAGNPAALV